MIINHGLMGHGYSASNLVVLLATDFEKDIVIKPCNLAINLLISLCLRLLQIKLRHFH